jgi:anti-sigma factor RsiW
VVNDEHVEEELLQRYFDGELAAPRAEEIARHLESCPRCAERRRSLAELHRAIAMAATERGQGLDSEALFARIEQGVRERPAPSAVERLSTRWRDFPEQRLRQIWVPAAGTLAAAAALLLFLRGTPQQVPEGAEPSRQNAGQDATATRTSIPNSEVEQVDFGGKAGTVFEVAVAEGISTSVVWINDDGELGEE